MSNTFRFQQTRSCCCNDLLEATAKHEGEDHFAPSDTKAGRGQMHNFMPFRFCFALASLVVFGCITQIENYRCNLSRREPASSWGNPLRGATTTKIGQQNHLTISGGKTKMADPLEQYQICHPSDWDSYVCKGPEYDRFADKLEGLLLFLEHQRQRELSAAWPLQSPKPKLWGKRKGSPFPANSNILAVGNSHTRQTFQALNCQYPVKKQYIDVEAQKSDNVMRRGSYYFVEFENSAKLHLVSNHALFYSQQWPRYLQELVNHTLADFDALIVGKMNSFAEAYNTSFMEVMMEKTAKYEQADFTTNPPPTVLDWAELYQGPIVAHSMFCDWGGDHLYWDMYEQVEALKEKRPIRLVNGRQYMPWLGECATDNWQGVGVCGDDATAHRCIGARGGHPDLVAWDIVEALHELVMDQTEVN